MDTEKIALIAFGVLAVAIIGYFIWKYFSAKTFPPSQYTSNNSLDSSINTTLPKGNKIVSPSGNASLILSDDGNLSSMLGNAPIQSTGTNFPPIGNCLKLEKNGSLTIYSADNKPKWSTQPLTSNTGNFILTVADTGELDILNFDTGTVNKITFIPLPPPKNIFPPPQYNSQNSMDSVVNTTLKLNTYINSNQQNATMAMQPDGNLVISTNNRTKVVFSSATNFVPVGYTAKLNSNGSLTISTKDGLIVWTTGVLGNSKYILTLDEIGGVNILDYITGKNHKIPLNILGFPPTQYASGVNSRDTLAWNNMPSGGQIVSPGGTASLRMQTDGNLVSYIGSGTGNCVGQSGTPLNSGAYMVFSPDGSISVRKKGDGSPLWSSPSLRISRYILTIDDSGVLHLLDYLSGTSTILQLKSC
jgi:hypothetical protein